MDNRLDLGFAFDGDADRLISVSSGGNVIDGDMIIYMLAKHMKERGVLRENTVVGTSHTNMGIESALTSLGIKLIRTDIGDKYVLARLVQDGLSLGGEQSGHVILKDIHSTGDGILCAIAVANMMAHSGKGLDELFDACLYPQTNVNITVKDKLKIMNSERLAASCADIRKSLGADGRVMVTYRYIPSGTQNTFAAFMSRDSIEATGRREQRIRVVPLDYDRNPSPDIGYTGWVQFSDGEIYVVNYIKDDADKAFIRGYSFYPEDVLLPENENTTKNVLALFLIW